MTILTETFIRNASLDEIFHEMGLSDDPILRGLAERGNDLREPDESEELGALRAELESLEDEHQALKEDFYDVEKQRDRLKENVERLEADNARLRAMRLPNDAQSFLHDGVTE